MTFSNFTLQKPKSKMLISLNLFIIIACVASQQTEGVVDEDNSNFRENRQVNEDTYDAGPIDLHDQLQTLNNPSPEEQRTNDEHQPPHNSWSALVPGTPGKDYPSLDKIPETSFTCLDKIPGGYYADAETGCQVFHICNIGGFKSSFLCPEGSIFNQRHYVCDWWYSFDCDEAVSLYPQPTEEPNDTSNYEPIELANNSPKDLAPAGSGESAPPYNHQRLPKDDNDPLSDEQRDSTKLERKSMNDYTNDHSEKLQQNSPTNRDHRQYNRNSYNRYHNHENNKETNAKSYTENEDANAVHRVNKGDSSLQPTTMEIQEEYSTHTSVQGTTTDTIPRGFSFNRQTPRNAYHRSQIPRQQNDYSNFNDRTAGFNGNSDKDIRYVPAL